MSLSIAKGKDRMEQLSRAGCVVCRLVHGSFMPNEVHHITRGGRRLGHRYTIPLSPWYHRAVPENGLTPQQMRDIYGPSFAESKAEFEAMFGTEEYLLQEADKWLGIYLPDSWYQEIGSHGNQDSPSSTAESSPTSTTTASSPQDEQSSDGSGTSSAPSKNQPGTKPPPSSAHSSKKKPSRKPTSTT